MKKGIKVLSMVLVLVMLGLSIAACGKGGEKTEISSSTTSSTTAAEEKTAVEDANYDNGLPKDQEVNIKVGLLESGYGREWFDIAVKLFTEKYPNVKFDITASPTIGELISTRAAAGDDEEMFDIFYGSAWAEFVNANKLEPMTDVFQMSPSDAPDKKIDDLIIPGFNNPETYYKNNAWLFPIANYIGGMFFDQVFFEENGWNTAPKTYNEFLQLCEDIKNKGIDPVIYAGLYDYSQFAFDTKKFEIAEENGNKAFRENFEYFNGPQYTSPESIEVYRRLYEMGKKGYISKKSVGMNHTQSQMLVLQHKAAMCPSGDWIENEMKDSTPEGFKWGFMAVPFTNNTAIPIRINSGLSYSIEMWAAKPELNKKWSKQFIASLMTNEVQQVLVEKGGGLPLRKDYMSDPARAQNMRTLQKSISAYMEANNVAVEFKLRKIELTDPDYAASLKVLGDNMALVQTGQKEPEPVLEEAEKLIQIAIEKDKKAQGK